jgi:hypothetical protein
MTKCRNPGGGENLGALVKKEEEEKALGSEAPGKSVRRDIKEQTAAPAAYILQRSLLWLADALRLEVRAGGAGATAYLPTDPG